MVNAWVEHVKDFARRKRVAYGCAVSNPECSKEYKTMKALKGMKKVMGSITAKQLHKKKKGKIVKIEL
jgi:hypothetical protein